MRTVKNGQAGFTLIELVVVIVILGILAVTALPQFIDLSDEAETAAMDGVVGAINSASAINYAARKANPAKGQAVANCTDAATLLQGGAMPSGYTMVAGAVTADTPTSCTVSGPGASGTASVIGIS